MPSSNRISGQRGVQLLLIPMFLAVVAACGGSLSAGAGYAVPISSKDADGAWLLEARGATSGAVRFGAAFRARLGDTQTIAIAPEVTFALEVAPVTLALRTGVHLVQMDRAADTWKFSAFTPYISPVIEFHLGSPVWFYAGAVAEYLVHFSSEPNTFSIGGQAGVGFSL